MAGLGVGRFTMSDWSDKRLLFKLCMPGGRISTILLVKSEMSVDMYFHSLDHQASMAG